MIQPTHGFHRCKPTSMEQQSHLVPERKGFWRVNRRLVDGVHREVEQSNCRLPADAIGHGERCELWAEIMEKLETRQISLNSHWTPGFLYFHRTRPLSSRGSFSFCPDKSTPDMHGLYINHCLGEISEWNFPFFYRCTDIATPKSSKFYCFFRERTEE